MPTAPYAPVGYPDLDLLDSLDADDQVYAIDVSAARIKRAVVGAIGNAARRKLAVTLTANQNDWNPTGLSAADWIVITGTTITDIKVTGLQGGVDGRMIFITNSSTSTARVVLSGEDSASTAAYRFRAANDRPLVRLNPGRSCAIFYNETTSRWNFIALPAGAGGEGLEPKAYVEMFYLADLSTLVQSANSGTAGAAATWTAWAPGGYAALATGTNSAGSAGAGTKSLARFATPTDQLILGRFKITMPSALSDGTNTYTVRAGFIDSLSGESTDGIFIRYTHGTNSGKYQLVARAGGAETAVDTGIAAVAGETVEFCIAIYGGLATPAADLYLANSANAMAKVATATGIPTGSQLYGAGALIVKSLGGTSRTLNLHPFLVA